MSKLLSVQMLLIVLIMSCQSNTFDASFSENSTIEEDRAVLTTLLTEIQYIANSVRCTNSNDWSYVAYGSKACGGPQGYIAYSNQINVEGFLTKVANYTKLEEEFNTKWSIVSTCDIPVEPIDVECVNGTPSFVY